jgi:hypothetical protein
VRMASRCCQAMWHYPPSVGAGAHGVSRHRNLVQVFIPRRLADAASAKALLDFVREQLSPTPPWERGGELGDAPALAVNRRRSRRG